MSDALGLLRLTLISLVAMAGMVCWLIIHNGLWQREAPDTTSSRSSLVRNLSTLATVAIGVLRMAFFLHDEVVVHAPEDLADDDVVAAVRAAASTAGRLLFGAFPVDFPLDVAVVRSWADAG